MTDDELVQFAMDFREGMLEGRSSHRCCFLVCWPLESLLECEGVSCRLVEGDLETMNHFWLALPDGRVLDPTADQFNTEWARDPYPPVYLGPPRAIHQEKRRP